MTTRRVFKPRPEVVQYLKDAVKEDQGRTTVYVGRKSYDAARIYREVLTGRSRYGRRFYNIACALYDAEMAVKLEGKTIRQAAKDAIEKIFAKPINPI